jgi:nitrogen regulatory protein P-II 1
MKEIKAVIQPNKLEKIRSALHNIKQFPGMTVMKVQGCSGNDRQAQRRRNPLDELTDYSNKIMIFMVCPDHLVEGVLQIIAECASTGQKVMAWYG